MKLYHFCPKHLIDDIKRQGLTLGVLPFVFNNRCILSGGIQWLTKNPSFEQSWEMDSTLKYRRNDFRLTIKISNDDGNLFQWIEFCKIPMMKETADILNACGDPENWFIYIGRINPNKFREIVENK